VGLGIAAALAMPGRAEPPVAHAVSRAARQVAITAIARAVVVTTAVAASAVAAAVDSTAVAGSAAATVVAAADTGKVIDRRKRLALASRFLLCVGFPYFVVAFRKVFTLGVPQPVTLSQPLVTVSELSKPKLKAKSASPPTSHIALVKAVLP
jgi:hypothetical protein